jgi:hypothetical protein
MSLVFDNNKKYTKDNFETDYGIKSNIMKECQYKTDTATNLKTKKIDNLIYLEDNEYGYDYPDVYTINNDTLTIIFHYLNHAIDKSIQAKRKYLKVK